MKILALPIRSFSYYWAIFIFFSIFVNEIMKFRES